MVRHLIREAHRALAILANSPDGLLREHLVHSHGFSRQMLAGLIRSGLAAAEYEDIEGGDKLVAVARLRITQAGRDALAES